MLQRQEGLVVAAQRHKPSTSVACFSIGYFELVTIGYLALVAIYRLVNHFSHGNEAEFLCVSLVFAWPPSL